MPNFAPSHPCDWANPLVYGEETELNFAPGRVLLTDGTELSEATNAISPDGRCIVGRGGNAATGRPEAFFLDTSVTGIADEPEPLPVEVALYRNYQQSAR